ncbi:MAG TPA: heavy metal sensor histidine kinase [Pseudomonas sp.]|nr:heavy metal sensor histidine kinase [Pseudomonas sp.]
MSRLSLTARLSLMFMLAVTSVLVAAGWFFQHLSQHHFDELDRHALAEKRQASEQILGGLTRLAQFNAARPELEALLAGHRDMAALILDPGGRILFSEPSGTAVPGHYLQLAGQTEWEWQYRGRFWRGTTGRVELPGNQQLTVLLMLDVTSHKAFFHTLAGWLWAALILFALVSALMGWLLARSSLRPLRELAQVTASISAQSLKARLPSESIPAELRQLVLAFNAMLARLEEAFFRLSNFSADIAHELRTPLSNLMTHTEVVLSRARSTEAYQENLFSNLEELRRMARMIDDMLFLAKADNGLIIPEREPIELHALCEKLLEFYQLSADERGIRFELAGAARIQGDVQMLHRALSNLLSNALRHTADGQRIRLSIEQNAQRVSLAVANPGAGIAPEHLERIFDRFYRVDPARREGQPGNAGLGLAITRSIVDAHQGRISCTSAEGWTTFVLEFPA